MNKYELPEDLFEVGNHRTSVKILSPDTVKLYVYGGLESEIIEGLKEELGADRVNVGSTSHGGKVMTLITFKEVDL